MISASKLFYSSVGLSYFFAMISLYQQAPGLVGSDGLLPADVFVSLIRKYNNWSGMSLLLEQRSLVLMAPDLFLTTDALIDFLLILGIVCSFFIFLGYHNSFLFASCWLIFHSMKDAFQTFTSFQWDILLLECGFLCILSTPLFSFKVNHPRHFFNWCFRFLAFKLMLQAGLVKLQAQCPTWDSLSALEYHFATQCIPTPLAWLAHQMPPIALRLGVAATLLFEIPLTVLLIAPFVYIRRMGCVFQWLLQAMIILTGNYNYFNFLTCVLMVKVWEADDDSQHMKFRFESESSIAVRAGAGTVAGRGGGAEAASTSISLPCSILASPGVFCGSVISIIDSHGPFVGVYLLLCGGCRGKHWAKVEIFLGVVIIIAVTIMCVQMQVHFPVSASSSGSGPGSASGSGSGSGSSLGSGLQFEWWRGEHVQWLWPWTRVQPLVSPTVNWSTAAVLLFSLTEAMVCMYRTLVDYQNHYELHSFPSPRFPALQKLYYIGCGVTTFTVQTALTTVALSWILLCALSFSSLCDVSPLTPSFVSPAVVSDVTRLFGVSSYGLFRRMTGVGAVSMKEQKQLSTRWNTSYVPSVVSRPELVLEGLHPSTGEWMEIEFRHKPGNLFIAPSFIAPLQPRLDWQMWFAALGSYQHNPWLVHLVYKLLHARPKQSGGRGRGSGSDGGGSSGGGGDGSGGGRSGKHQDVLELIDLSTYPFTEAPPTQIRVFAYDYDFTRWNASWNIMMPHAVIVPYFGINSTTVDGSNSNSNSNSDSRKGKKEKFKKSNSNNPTPTGAGAGAGTRSMDEVAWWTRRNKREYLPGLEANNPSLKEFLKGNQFSISAASDGVRGRNSKDRDPTLKEKTQQCRVLSSQARGKVLDFLLEQSIYPGSDFGSKVMAWFKDDILGGKGKGKGKGKTWQSVALEYYYRYKAQAIDIMSEPIANFVDHSLYTVCQSVRVRGIFDELREELTRVGGVTEKVVDLESSLWASRLAATAIIGAVVKWFLFS